MSIKQCYDSLGYEYDLVAKRLGSESLVDIFSIKFFNDNTFSELISYMQDKDFDNATKAAHTLKGLANNLGFSDLGKSCANLNEALKQHFQSDYDYLLSKVITDYNNLKKVFNKFL